MATARCTFHCTPGHPCCAQVAEQVRSTRLASGSGTGSGSGSGTGGGTDSGTGPR